MVLGIGSVYLDDDGTDRPRTCQQRYGDRYNRYRFFSFEPGVRG